MGDSGASVHPIISIRKAGPDDLVVLTHLALLAVDEQRDSRGGAVWSRREARVDPATSLADALATPTGSVFVGALDGEIVAYGVLALETLTWASVAWTTGMSSGVPVITALKGRTAGKPPRKSGVVSAIEYQVSPTRTW